MMSSSSFCRSALLLCMLVVAKTQQAKTTDRDIKDAEQHPNLRGQEVVATQNHRLLATQKTTDSNGFTIWRNTVNAGCTSADHSFTLDIDVDPAQMSDVRFTTTNFDVDFTDPNQNCNGGPEVDILSLNGNELGILRGANNAWSVNSFPLTPSAVIQGANSVFIDTDAPGTGCWCVAVGYVEIRAKVGFNVEMTTPAANDKNRSFKKSDVDLTVEFSDDYEPSTLTTSSFLVEYRDAGGAWQSESGSFSQLNPKKFRFVPTNDLKDGIRYRVTIKSGPAGVTSTAGAELKQDEKWFFWTIPDLDVSDAFGGACAPDSSPCNGVDVAIFQVSRNADIVFNKQAVARVFLRWKPHTNVLPADQVDKLKADVELTGGGVAVSKIETVKRQDKMTAADKVAAKNSINIYYTPTSGQKYDVLVTPRPQTNASPVQFTASRLLGQQGAAGALTFDYHFLQAGTWAGGIPAAVKPAGRTLMTTGTQFVSDVFPITAATYTEKADITIAYNFTGKKVNEGACGNVTEVFCPLLAKTTSEARCVYAQLKSMQAGKKTIAATVPAGLCLGATAFELGGVFMHQHGQGANAETVAHEIGHVFNLQHPAGTKSVEGFQVRIKKNRSVLENPTKALQLMGPNRPAGTRWIANTDYDLLLGQSYTRRLLRELAPTGDYLNVFGDIDFDRNSLSLAPAFIQNVPNNIGDTSGLCAVRLLDSTGSTLSETFVDPGDSFSISLSAGTVANGPPGTFFSVSVLWDDMATSVFVDCGSGITASIVKSANLPSISILSPVDGATLSGTSLVTWIGDDPDGGPVSYQLQASGDGGTTWQPQTPLTTSTSQVLDTALFPNNDDLLVRVMVTDGFNVAYDTISVQVANEISTLSILPGDLSFDVEVGTDVRARFSSPIDPSTLSSSTFLLSAGGSFVASDVAYESATRTAILKPLQLLESGVTYTASITTFVRGEQGESVSAISWSFTTEADVLPPSIVGSSPGNGDSNVPVNGLIQVTFNEEINSSSITPDNFQLLDDSGVIVSSSITYFAGERRAILIPATDLGPDSSYQIVVQDTVTDLAGNSLDSPFGAFFVTGSDRSLGVRIVGNYDDRGIDLDADGLFDALDVSVDVEVLTRSNYNLNGRLVDRSGRLIDWTSSASFVEIGIHQFTLRFPSGPIRSSGLDGPYTLDALNVYQTSNVAIDDTGFDVYDTFPYPVEQYFAILTFGSIPDQLFQVGQDATNVLDLPSVTTHASEPLDSISYSLTVNSDPNLEVVIDSNGVVSFNPVAGIEINSDVTLAARDLLGNVAETRFDVRFELPRAAEFIATSFEEEMLPGSTQTISFEVMDQFGSLLTSSVNVELSATNGMVSPMSTTSSSGVFSVEFTAAMTEDVAFLTATSGEATKVLTVAIISPPTPAPTAEIVVDTPMPTTSRSSSTRSSTKMSTKKSSSSTMKKRGKKRGMRNKKAKTTRAGKKKKKKSSISGAQSNVFSNKN